MPTKPKPKPGGARPGAGRPRLFNEPTEQICFSLPRSTIAKLNRLAETPAGRSKLLAKLIGRVRE